ncbi:MAG: PAS domain-containing protein [Bryobacterales bacterium]|nr:PAS domain-containing protein [Bryobacterales bacterium]
MPKIHFEDLERDPAIIYVLDWDLRIVHCNLAWDQFAEANGGARWRRTHVIGTPAMSVVPPDLFPFYSGAFAQVRRTGESWTHRYECSSPGRLRVFHMNVLPCLESNQILVVHSLAVERPHGPERPPVPGDPGVHCGADGLLRMCSHCRRTKRASEPVWDWVPSFVERAPAPVSHGLCPVCIMYYYPDVRAHRQGKPLLLH